MSGSARFNLPFLTAGQAQKEFTHNEALQTLDLIAAAAVEDADRTDPPTSPAIGSCYIVGASATGAWGGNDHSIAGFTSGGWRFIPPVVGMVAYVKAAGAWASYRDGAWELGILRASSLVLGGQQVVGLRAAAIAAPNGGGTVDIEARTAISQMLAALRQHGLIES